MGSVFCTILSKYRLYQAMAMFCSLHEVMSDFIIHTLCVDGDTYELLSKMNWENVRLTVMDDLDDEGLTRLRNTRRLNEYCWTLKPVYLDYLFERNPQLLRITYIDSDLFFFSDPSVIFRAQPHSSVLLSKGDIRIPILDTRDTSIIQSMLGNYNSGFISFKQDETGRKCLAWWKEQCLECCASMPAGGRFGDQKYLDDMPELFPNVAEIETPGVNLGHWNSFYYNFSLYQGAVYADLNKLICYHFSGFRVLKGGGVLMIHEADRICKPFFYAIYVDILQKMVDSIRIIEPDFDGCSNQEDLSVSDKPTQKSSENPGEEGNDH